VADTLVVNASFSDNQSIDKSGKFKIYANAASNQLIVSIDNYNDFTECTLKIIDVDGIQIFNSRVISNQFNIPYDHFLKRGIFLFQLFDQRGTLLEVKKIVLR
jgi:hypothetical protein